MDVTFVDEQPHQKARPFLDDILSKGTERIMIACAFCTGAGVVLLQRHLARLRRPGSCLVVSSEPPTDMLAVNELAKAAPDRVWVHTTGRLPQEKKVGGALMHSKVFYAEAPDKCWLWVGSHNLTARATEGANLEAALMLSGHPTEEPFVAARAHIQACRQESSRAPLEVPPTPEGDSVDIVVIHAETVVLPTATPVWHAQMGLVSAEYDWLLKPPADVRLHLYHPGALKNGWQSATPWASHQGTLTGLNFTAIHPSDPGGPAQWDSRYYSITDNGTALWFADKPLPSVGIVTQGLINIQGPAEPDEAFLSARPKTETRDDVRDFVLGDIDPDFVRFFTRESVQDGKLVYELRRRGDPNWIVPLQDLRSKDRLMLESEAGLMRVPMKQMQFEDSERRRHPLIMRAKFRWRKRPGLE